MTAPFARFRMPRQRNYRRDGFVIRLNKLHHARVRFNSRTLAFGRPFNHLTSSFVRLPDDVRTRAVRSIGPSGVQNSVRPTGYAFLERFVRVDSPDFEFVRR